MSQSSAFAENSIRTIFADFSVCLNLLNPPAI